MSGISPEVWSRLAADHPVGETLRARRATPDTSTRLLAALDAASERHLLILLVEGEDDLQDSQSRGLSIETRPLQIPGHEPGRYLDISCKDAAGHEAFDLIGRELADRLATFQEAAPELVARVIAKWRRFWGQLPRQMLTREEQLGLFAEVWFLSIWLMPRVGAAAADRWRGPHRARHDFEWSGQSVEVKATTSVRGRIHFINGIEQLAPPEQGKLMFFSLRLREEGGATNTLPSVIAACRVGLEPFPDALSRFEATLGIAGYSAAYEDEYAKMRLRVVEEGLYRVEDDFPRLIPASFPAGVPAGIEHINYEINLTGSNHLIVATNTAQAIDL